ncbi:hypothetical protein LZ30DRAFT_95231 [Colletotrichum cereale]|nr:hypothetical protein LZ30DRAFT_95231 [Colletotrichum cereale]
MRDCCSSPTAHGDVTPTEPLTEVGTKRRRHKAKCSGQRPQCYRRVRRDLACLCMSSPPRRKGRRADHSQQSDSPGSARTINNGISCEGNPSPQQNVPSPNTALEDALLSTDVTHQSRGIL